VTRGSRKPLVVGIAAAAIVAALGAVFLLRQPAPVPAPVQVPAQVQVAQAPEATLVPAAAPPLSAPAPAPAAAAPVAPPEPVKPKAPPAPAKPPVPARVAEAEPRSEPLETAPDAPRPTPVAAAPATQASPAPEDGIGPVQSLPEAVQRELPKVSFGGYIYSPNPAERLLLVDKMLRREGEEVAPGLVLERLLPKAAIMNFRGYRYRVAY
jgi:general secretion pathway protein B